MSDTTLDWEQELEYWELKYKPIMNHIDPTNYDKFETYGEELRYVMAQDPKCIWTLVDGDDGNLYIVDGYHLVNRVAYFVTEVPFDGDFLAVPYYIFEECEIEEDE